MVIIPYSASLIFLDAIVAALLEGAALALFQNDYVPIHTTGLGDLVEADFDGYARITLAGWPPAAIDANNRASTNLGFQTFTKTGNLVSNDIYGAYVLDGTGNFLFAERFQTSPFTLSVAGQLLLFKPYFTFTSEF